MRLGEVLAQSRFFKDAAQAAQCVVKVLYGAELGVAPVSAMMGIHIIEGKPAPSANLMAAIIKRSVVYDYRVIEHTDDACTIAFFERGAEIGRSRWARQDAERAELWGRGNWKKYPRAMLFNRALTEGVRTYCPDLFGGAPVYVAEELASDVIETQGRTVNEATGEVTEPAARVSRAAEQEASYAGSSGLAAPTVASVRERCTKLMGEIGVPAADLSKPKGYLQRALGRDIGKFSDLSIEDWQEIEGALGVTLDTKRAAFGAYGEWCRREGHDKGDRDFRLSTWGEIIGHVIETTGSLTQPEFAKVAESLKLAAQELDGTTPETALPYDDPFEE